MPKIETKSSTSTPLVSGFSLIELIIVILIASLFAALVFNNVNFSTKKRNKVGIFQLKEAADENKAGEGELVCVDKCRQCSLASGRKLSEIGSKLRPLKAYILDDSGNPQEIDFGRIKDKKICLRFHYYANGSTSQMILESGEKFYFIPSYFGKIEVFEGIDEAAERWQKYRNQLDSMGSFY